MRNKLATVAMGCGALVMTCGLLLSYNFKTAECRQQHSEQVAKLGPAVNWDAALTADKAGRVPNDLTQQQLSVLYPVDPTDCVWEGESRSQSYAILFGLLAAICVYVPLAAIRGLARRLT